MEPAEAAPLAQFNAPAAGGGNPYAASMQHSPYEATIEAHDLDEAEEREEAAAKAARSLKAEEAATPPGEAAEANAAVAPGAICIVRRPTAASDGLGCAFTVRAKSSHLPRMTSFRNSGVSSAPTASSSQCSTQTS